MKIKVLAAMMALASTGALATTNTAEGNGTFTATTTNNATCVVTAPENMGNAKVTIGADAALEADKVSFTVATNVSGNVTATVDVTSVGLKGLNGVELDEDETGVDGVAVKADVVQPDESGNGTVTVGAFTKLAQTAIQAVTAAKTTATITITCPEA